MWDTALASRAGRRTPAPPARNEKARSPKPSAPSSAGASPRRDGQRSIAFFAASATLALALASPAAASADRRQGRRLGARRRSPKADGVHLVLLTDEKAWSSSPPAGIPQDPCIGARALPGPWPTPRSASGLATPLRSHLRRYILYRSRLALGACRRAAQRGGAFGTSRAASWTPSSPASSSRNRRSGPCRRTCRRPRTASARAPKSSPSTHPSFEAARATRPGSPRMAKVGRRTQLAPRRVENQRSSLPPR